MSFFFSGNGHASGGDFYITSGTARDFNTGEIFLYAGSSTTGLGGDIIFRAGHATKETGGDITIASGSGVFPGNVIFFAGSSVDEFEGSIIVGPAVAAFLVADVPSVFVDCEIFITGGDDEVVITVPFFSNEFVDTTILSWNDNSILIAPPIVDFNNINPADTLPQQVATLRDNLKSLIAALSDSPSCFGHGLVQVIDELGNPTTCNR